MKAKLEEAKAAKSNELLNNYIIGYSLKIRSTDPADNDHEVWRKMTVSRAEFMKVGFAARLRKTTKRLKLIEGIDLDKAKSTDLLGMIEKSGNMVLLHNPDEYRKQVESDTKKSEADTKKSEADTKKPE